MPAKAEKTDNMRTRTAVNRLGTFGGVFTPSILTILGVIMLGMQLPETSGSLQFQSITEETLSGLPTTLLICSSGEADIFQ